MILKDNKETLDHADSTIMDQVNNYVIRNCEKTCPSERLLGGNIF